MSSPPPVARCSVLIQCCQSSSVLSLAGATPVFLVMYCSLDAARMLPVFRLTTPAVVPSMYLLASHMATGTAWRGSNPATCTTSFMVLRLHRLRRCPADSICASCQLDASISCRLHE